MQDSANPRTYAPFGIAMPAPADKPGLYLVATPIGNLGDITLRALEVLAGADVIACEDTRVTRKLLDRYGIATPLTSYHEHNATEARPKLLARLADDHAVASGHSVTALPGASSVLTALPLSGLPTDRFFFEGFLPPKRAARQKRIAALASIPATLVLFETGPRIADSLADLASGLGYRKAAICRELTKLHEEIRRGPLGELASAYISGAETRGEFVIVIAPPSEQEVQAGELDELLRQALARVSTKEAVAEVALATGKPRREVYRRALELTKDQHDGA